jgi:hypothetical protein
MSENKTVQMEKPSNKKKIVAIAVTLVILVFIIAGVATQIPQKSSTPKASPYVEVDYKTVGWYYIYNNGGSCLLLNLTITNKGYTGGGIAVNAYSDFSVNVSNVVYNPIGMATIDNSSSMLGFTVISATLQDSVTLLNSGSETGSLIFSFANQLYNNPFTLRCSMTEANNIFENVNVKVFQK